MKSRLKRLYLYLESTPDRLYPFRSEIEGRGVRGYQSYRKRVEAATQKYGPQALGFQIQLYRAAWHLFGSILIIVGATFVSKHFFGSETALYVLLGLAIIALFVQEFISHPARYNQPLYKNFTDWLTWAVPMLIYIFFWL